MSAECHHKCFSPLAADLCQALHALRKLGRRGEETKDYFFLGYINALDSPVNSAKEFAARIEVTAEEFRDMTRSSRIFGTLYDFSCEACNTTRGRRFE
ncbi:hypothetical protein AVEN_271528-1 [Araneus ventricosus]|uniref:Uncharacterized protein n=1 Tax=Araneus ventricosus TaxID=182803 RepID=A0A4Y2FZ38_ARAVE|nr:hypothetical protein AVEN_271528-1 [Araneus ventricosus]